MTKQKNIKVIAVDLSSGEAELLSVAAQYFADRLLTTKQQKSITLLIDAAHRPIRIPLSRDMLSETTGIFGVSLPSVFEMSVSTAPGIRDTLETMAHEIIHIAQVLNRRLRIRAGRAGRIKSGATMRITHSATWLGDKFARLDECPWHLRPWEIEACQWQSILVDEFVERMTGANPEFVTQRGRHNQLALFQVRPLNIKAPSPALSSPSIRAPEDVSVSMIDPKLSAIGMMNTAKNGAQEGVHNGTTNQRQDDVTHSASNGDENTGIHIRVAGLDAPRLLSRCALNSKLDDLLARGLMAPEDVKAAKHR